ncbi:histone acetyltransferase 1, partial [Myotisia sp. PD_48]
LSIPRYRLQPNKITGTLDANDVVELFLVQPSSDEKKLTTLSTIYPEFTYPIFGDDETIFGYKGLVIQIRFAAHDLRSNVHITYDDKFEPVEDIKAVDLPGALSPFLPENAFSSLDDFRNSLNNDQHAADFKPPGNLRQSYCTNGRHYEIWEGSLADPIVRAQLDRIQIFVSLFIEAGTPILTDDFDWTLERWTVYFVYEKLNEPPTPSGSEYSFVGYATTYRWYFYEPQTLKDSKLDLTSNQSNPFETSLNLSNLPARLRIAQFLILKPHQQSGHGTDLYRTIHRICLEDPTIYELTIEDPNEAFDVLRDRNDYRLLRPEFVKHNISVNPDPFPKPPDGSTQVAPKHRRHPRRMPTSLIIPTKTLDELRHKFKIAPTQFAHLMEMYLLGQIPEAHRGSGNVNMTRLLIQKSRAPDENDRRYYWWRMLVKQRLYKRHRDMLIQIERSERAIKLDETLENVEEGYEALLKVFEKQESKSSKEKAEGKKEAAGTPLSEQRKRKRNITAFEEDDDDEAEAEAVAEEEQITTPSNGTNQAKKAKV